MKHTGEVYAQLQALLVLTLVKESLVPIE